MVVSTAVTPATRPDWMWTSSCNCQKHAGPPRSSCAPQALDLVSRDGKHVVPTLWKPEIFSLIKLAAQDKDVTRIFVNPAIKQQLCLDAGTDRDWLRKVRPWFQHRAHMHVRLRCPADSLECEDQPLPPPGDGCGAELQSWFEPPKPGTTKPEKKTPPPLPPSCQALLDEHVI
ncbi:penicillin-insensitive murein endopeptidase [Escherichia coli]|uniref:Penicillin-insensitive murein endopeptidase n=1 Tax=Escherichia coli TaxID=562 RepID=A0A485JC83_ECOLX|nr:penicillin-insensitive murein endopeptidase [Escherichia coli]